ncbi:MAG: hypothetical protein ACAH07_06060 [Methylophilaceae bacterium]|nr:hypothetical protein [Methyloradius sp.]
MAEPLHSTAITVIAGGGASVLTGAISGDILGVSASALLFGFMGGFCALIYMEHMKWQGQAATVFGSTIIGGVFSPLVFAAALHYASWLAEFDAALRIGSAFGVGIAAPVAIPILIKYMRSKFGSTPEVPPGGGNNA